MSFRFRKTIRIAPGLRLNLSKRGTSLSVGERGLTANLSRRRARATAGLAGSGLSYTTRSYGRRRLRRHPHGSGLFGLLLLVALLWLVFH